MTIKSTKPSNEFGAALCEALHVDPNLVNSVSIEAVAGDALRVTFRMLIHPDTLEMTDEIKDALTSTDANVTVEIKILELDDDH